MAVSIVIPWRGGCPDREAALSHVIALYQREMPEVDIALGRALARGPWIKATAVVDGLSRTSGDVVAIADADVWCDGLRDAISAVEAGAPWGIPHRLVHRLSRDATRAVFLGDPPGGALVEHPYPGVEGGGIVILPRLTLARVPLDPRFEGFGQEDESWAMALHRLAGPPWRGTADLWHFYHPPQPRLDRRRGSEESWRLRRRYMKARRDADAMRELLDEIPTNCEV